MTRQDGTESPAAMLQLTAADKPAEAKGYLTLVFHWTVSMLYYSSGEA